MPAADALFVQCDHDGRTRGADLIVNAVELERALLDVGDPTQQQQPDRGQREQRD